jgi:mono/diheme cytochrome c family protein
MRSVGEGQVPIRRLSCRLAFLLALTTAGGLAFAQDKPIPEMPAEYLSDPENIQVGKEIWDDQCQHCHGRDAYPGKAPKLRPAKYSPDFVYHRVTYGFRGMPPWEEIYTEEERMDVVAYILSPEFSP